MMNEPHTQYASTFTLSSGSMSFTMGNSAKALALVARMPDTARSDRPKKVPILPSGLAR